MGFFFHFVFVESKNEMSLDFKRPGDMDTYKMAFPTHEKDGKHLSRFVSDINYEKRVMFMEHVHCGMWWVCQEPVLLVATFD